jgi:hypothetical protein
MKVKLHAVFKNQLGTFETSIGLLWFIVVKSGQHHRIERMQVSMHTAASDLSRFFTPENYQFIRMENDLCPVFKKT